MKCPPTRLRPRDYLTSRIPAYPAQRWCNRNLEEGARVALVGETRRARLRVRHEVAEEEVRVRGEGELHEAGAGEDSEDTEAGEEAA